MGNVYEILKERGFVRQVTNEEAVGSAFGGGRVTAYLGFDPTADSLHVGNLLGIMALVHLQRAGHVPIAIIGDGTSMIGDPSGKTEMRKMLRREMIVSNADAIEKQLGTYLTLDGTTGIAARNGDWLLELKYIDFLRDIGRNFSVNRMLTAEAYKTRLETGLSFIEFNYQILQAYDFLTLYRQYHCTVQVGGDDQWGNIVAGVDLVRRIEGAEVQAFTWPLLTTADGQKMGKTAAGAVWLDARKTSPYEFYQYWINIDDRDVAKCLAYFTLLPMDEIRRLGALQGADIREAKKVLAYEAAKITHGEQEASQAREASGSAFGDGTGSLDSVPSSTVESARIERGLFVVDLAAESGLTSSKGEARRLIKQGGLYVNQTRIESPETMIRSEDIEKDIILLRAGKKRYHRIVVE
jgi:tyrosyl-tRNA synthetase